MKPYKYGDLGMGPDPFKYHEEESAVQVELRRRQAKLEPVENWVSAGDLQAKLDRALAALRAIRQRHERLNILAGRPIENSATIALCDAVLKDEP